MSRLENMIRENREAFDSYEPGTQVWDTIQKNLETKPGKLTTLKSSVWKWAAAAAVFLVAVITWYQLKETKPPAKDSVAVTEVTEENVPDEYADEVYHFTKLINLKHKELQKYKKKTPPFMNSLRVISKCWIVLTILCKNRYLVILIGKR